MFCLGPDLYEADILPVGASTLAMVVNDNTGSLTPRGVLSCIASRLAPTGGALSSPAPAGTSCR
ncbi:hypothetical protein CES87_20895 [Pseudomonas sp. ERMR1:02]|nr:hypothetical protein CES87_20895 [Pseudomonas sp. ERMR1:02]